MAESTVIIVDGEDLLDYSAVREIDGSPKLQVTRVAAAGGDADFLEAPRIKLICLGIGGLRRLSSLVIMAASPS
jgi:hypothetical protein